MSEETTRAIIEDDDDTDWEAEARAEGWVPEAEWQGAPPKHGFLTAKEFVKRGREVMPILHARNKRLEGELTAIRSQLTEMQATGERFNRFAQSAIERERREKEVAIQRLEHARAQAITDGDGQAAVTAERQIATLKAEPATAAESAPQFTEEQLAPVKAFIGENPWYTHDQTMRDWADARAVRLKAEGVSPGKSLLDRVASDARREFPHKFQGNGAFVAAVEGAGRRQPEQFGKRTFDDLPPEAKRAYDEFKKANPKLTHKEYLSYYEWD